ncbi:MAG: response regulator [Pseudomonadales bacterium]|nr:response regulator [Pseudomonadales bacterium]
MKIRILLTDDAVFIRDLIKRTLKKFLPQCEILEASDGKKAQSILNKTSFDLILSDWEMPGMSGEELLTWVRAHDKHAQTPFIMITSLGDKSNIMRAVEAGVSDYLGKPFSGEELMQKVQKALHKAGKLNTVAPVGGRSTGAFSSLEIFNPNAEPSILGSANTLLNAGTANAATAPKTRGTGLIKWQDRQLKCMIKQLGVDDMVLVARRSDPCPGILQTVQLELSPGNDVARLVHLEAYVHAIAAVEKKPDAEFLALTVRFLADAASLKQELAAFRGETPNA